MTCEFRVRWQREGHEPVSRIYQTEAAARRKIDGILALEEIKSDSRHWENMGDLIARPRLETREVGEWSPAEPGAQSEPSDSSRRGVAEWAGMYADDYGGVF